MLSKSQLYRGMKSPNLLLRELNKLYFTRLGSREHNTSGQDIFERDWDNLIILDACRYDIFKEESHLPGKLEQVTSKGASTTEFLDGNFADRELHDTVYVTANPQYYRHHEAIRCEPHDVVNVWLEDGWNEEYGTVLPKTVESFASAAAEEYENKRLVIHYLQPHYPFLDSNTVFDKGQVEDEGDDRAFWQQIMTGKLDVDVDRLWRLYERNLDQVLSSVERLLSTLTGKTVVTSDHGNMLGERSVPIPVQEWGHPRGVHTPELVEVPWLMIDGERREIIPEPPKHDDVLETEPSVDQRLRDLGYK